MSESTFIFVLPTGVIVTYLLTKFLIRLAWKMDIVDVPSTRSSHSKPVPRGGGLSIVIVFLVFLAANVQADLANDVYPTVLWLLFGGTAVAVIGLLDDLVEVGPLWRIIVHLGSVAAMLVILPAIPTLPVCDYLLEPSWFMKIFMIVILVWFINLFNFMDGIDGIAAVQTLSMLGGVLLISYLDGDVTWIPLLAFLASTVAGFLVWNWPPARVFMGDVCSGFLGFSLGAISLGTSLNGPMNLWSWTILGGVFLVDATVTLITRATRGQRWYTPHRCHAYQILSRKLDSHAKVTISVLAVNVVWLIPWAVVAAKNPKLGFVYCLIAWAPILVSVIFLGAGREEHQPKE